MDFFYFESAMGSTKTLIECGPLNTICVKESTKPGKCGWLLNTAGASVNNECMCSCPGMFLRSQIYIYIYLQIYVYITIQTLKNNLYSLLFPCAFSVR